MSAVGFTLLLGMAPAPAPIVEAVQEIEVESSVELASVLRLRLGIEQTALGDWTILELDPFRPLVPLTVRLRAGGPLPEALVNGYVATQDVRFGDEPGTAALEVAAMDATMLMNLEEKVEAWPSLPDGAIAAAIFGRHALVPQVETTSPVLVEPEGTTMQRGTDIRFLRRLAERNGFDVYVQPEPLSGVDMGYFRARRTTGLPQAVLNVAMGSETNVDDFTVHYDAAAPTGAVAATLDIATKSPQPALAPAATQLPLGAEPTLTRVLPPPLVRPAETGLTRSGDLQTRAQAIADRSSWSIVAEGTTGADVGVLRPGGTVNVRGAGRAYSGSYYVTRVHHTIRPDSYEQRFTARRNAVGLTGAEVFVDV